MRPRLFFIYPPAYTCSTHNCVTLVACILDLICSDNLGKALAERDSLHNYANMTINMPTWKTGTVPIFYPKEVSVEA
jgi:hypothetical protein